MATALGLAVVLLVLAAAVGLPLWALRRHRRLFPKGWDRTGWEPNREAGGRFQTMWAWLSGGRGGG